VRRARSHFGSIKGSQRTTGAFYFTKGRLISLEATVLPAKGSFASHDPDHFIDSIAFVLSHTEPGAVELETPKLD
jgi:hypothetical protein